MLKISKSFGSFIFVLLLAGCGKPTSPSNSETLDFLNSQQPASSPFKATSVTLETFPQGDGQCRVKFKATYETKVDLLESVSPEEAFRAVGWDANIYQQTLNAVSAMPEPYHSDLLSKLPNLVTKNTTLAHLVTKAGQTTENYGTLSANREVDHWAFTIIDLDNARINLPGSIPDTDDNKNKVVRIDTDIGQGLVADDAKKEQDFVNIAKAAQGQIAAANAAQAQADAEKHATYVKVLLDATAPNKTYVGSLVCDNGQSTIVKLVFVSQEQGGKIIAAKFENPSDASQSKGYNGTISYEGSDANPIRLDFDQVLYVKGANQSDTLGRWLSNNHEADGAKFHVNADGSLSGVGFFKKFELKPDAASTTAAAGR
jgi:hypothetical protein